MTRHSRSKIIVAVTMGDPAGIGPSLIAKGLPELIHLAEFRLIGDARILKKAAAGFKLSARGVEIVDLQNVDMKRFRFGAVRAEYGRASLEYIDRAIAMIRNRQADCLVTCPVSKEAVSMSGMRFCGHTEYLAERAGIKTYAMLLANDDLRFFALTRHIRLASVPRYLNAKLIIGQVRLAYDCLKRSFGIRSPRIVVCGLNPHASDNGLVGDEENRVIKPALKKLRLFYGIPTDGPLSADVAIAKARLGAYDAVMAMYHDQAMIPLKLFGNEGSVNMTVGLPYVRTSPLHGTAFDIAAKTSLVDPSSFIAATLTAIKCARNQKKA